MAETYVWWGTIPQEMSIQLARLDFTGKIVRVFTTHEGSGLANIPSDVKKICKGANVLGDSIAIRGADCKNAKPKVENWINN